MTNIKNRQKERLVMRKRKYSESERARKRGFDLATVIVSRLQLEMIPAVGSAILATELTFRRADLTDEPN